MPLQSLYKQFLSNGNHLQINLENSICNDKNAFFDVCSKKTLKLKRENNNSEHQDMFIAQLLTLTNLSIKNVSQSD